MPKLRPAGAVILDNLPTREGTAGPEIIDARGARLPLPHSRPTLTRSGMLRPPQGVAAQSARATQTDRNALLLPRA